MSFFKCLVSFLIVPFTSVFLLKLSCPLRKLLLFKWNQSCFSFLAHTMFLRASKGSGHPPRSTRTVSKRNNLFLLQTSCSSEAHTVRSHHPLCPLISLSTNLLSSPPFIQVSALIHWPIPLLSFVGSYLSSLAALSSKDLTTHGNRIAARVNFTECFLGARHCSVFYILDI